MIRFYLKSWISRAYLRCTYLVYYSFLFLVLFFIKHPVMSFESFEEEKKASTALKYPYNFTIDESTLNKISKYISGESDNKKKNICKKFIIKHVTYMNNNCLFTIDLNKTDLENSFKFQLIEAQLLPVIKLNEFPFLKKNLLLFLGTSSSGKSSVAKEYAKLVPSSIVLEYDHRLHKIILDFLIEQNHPKFSIFYNYFGLSILHLIFAHQSDPFLKRALSNVESPIDFINTLQELRELSLPHLKYFYKKASFSILEEAKFLVCLGRTVVVQAADNEGFSFFSEFDPFVVLVYCPFSKLAFRVEQRNEKAFVHNLPLELRHPLGVYKQFSKLYNAKHKGEVKTSLETINLSIVNSYIERGLQIDPFYRPPNFINTESFARELLSNMKCKNQKYAHIFPNYIYNFCVDTSCKTPVEGAISIKDIFSIFSKNITNMKKKIKNK